MRKISNARRDVTWRESDGEQPTSPSMDEMPQQAQDGSSSAMARRAISASYHSKSKWRRHGQKAGKPRPNTLTFTISEASSSSSSSFSPLFLRRHCPFIIVTNVSHLPFCPIVAHVYKGRSETLGVGWN